MSESLIPKGKKATDLTVAELAYASRKIKVDVMAALSADPPHPERVMALAWLACLWARRQNIESKIEEFTGLTFTELMARLATEEADEDGEEFDSLDDTIERFPTVSALA